ncbi:superoxide dismutase, Cu-Zn family [Lysobacter sp. yr284]|uniref:superoxide dismutase family protein n=1 Tax=Lysobacter TaxID=68 RepID=UPI00089BB952|nr:superoxide dismutase family protein [Lysobacter sp. yr284]SDZ24645.1 superoxide dismutase, Cu-Zn family [Lysobacter sp. yr284]
MNATLRIALLAAATAALAACGGQAVKPTPPPAATAKPVSTASSASVVLASASGSLVSGKLSVRPMGDGVHITGEIGGLTPNSTHAIHIHEKGDCSAADASSAGGHFNPAAQPHGQVDHGAHHAGDMDNLVANADGVAKVDAHASGVTLGGGAPNDVAGRAVIVHASADDYKSQPAGNAGARLACGIIKTGR